VPARAGREPLPVAAGFGFMGNGLYWERALLSGLLVHGSALDTAGGRPSTNQCQDWSATKNRKHGTPLA